MSGASPRCQVCGAECDGVQNRAISDACESCITEPDPTPRVPLWRELPQPLRAVVVDRLERDAADQQGYNPEAAVAFRAAARELEG